MPKSSQISSALLPKAPLLASESRDEFNRVCEALNDQIKPRGIIEQIYVEDIAYLVWEILRLRRCKTAIINLAFRAALTQVVTQLSREPGEWEHQVRPHSEELARKWFSDPD